MRGWDYCSGEDVEWLVLTARAAYGDEIEDVDATRRWFEAQLLNPDMCFIRAAQTAIVVNAQHRFYAPSKVFAKVVFVWSARPSSIALVEAIKGASEWAKGKGAPRLSLHLGNNPKSAALAKRIGAVIEFEAYALEL